MDKAQRRDRTQRKEGTDVPKINVLPKHIADLIAAGEVVERPASVVKELMENAIDAGADAVTVEIKRGGITYIRITDNGCGIARDDIRNAFKSHATSKIMEEKDLHQIGTLGFRGEALASVAAVSRVSVMTRTNSTDIGTAYRIEGSEEILLDDAGCPKGTTIVVSDLFYNTPARMKFLKKDVTEGNSVAGVVDRIALSHPEVSVRFIRDDRQQLVTTGNGQLASTVYSVFGKDFANGLVPADYSLNGIHISGLVSRPTFSRSNRSMQFFFLNGRLVKSKTAESALEQAYKNAIMVGRFPACVLNIEMPLGAVDVNVHPSKMEVRFANDRPVFDAVYYAAKNAIDKNDKPSRLDLARLDAKRAGTGFRNEAAEQLKLGKAAAGTDGLPEKVEGFWSKKLPPEYDRGRSGKAKSGKKTAVAAETPLEPVPYIPRAQRPAAADDGAPAAQTPAAPTNTAPYEAVPAPDDADAPAAQGAAASEPAAAPAEPAPAAAEIPEYRILGEAFKTYLFVELSDRILMIDKHAAHERILFNQLKEDATAVQSQLLMSPLAVTLSKEEYSALLRSKDLLQSAGFTIDDFGPGTIIVREVPVMLVGDDITATIQEMAGYLLDDRSPTPEKLDWIYANTACRAAIKAGNNTSPAEQKRLVDYLLSHREIRYCPHGRPITIELTRSDLEHQFGRIQ